MPVPCFYLYIQSRGAGFKYLLVHILMYYLKNGNKLCRVLSYLLKISLNQQHQPEHTLTLARNYAGAVMAGTANETTKRCTLLGDSIDGYRLTSIGFVIFVCL